MKPGLFQQLILYRYRYAVGYCLFILCGVMVLVWQLGDLGPGLAAAEKTSALTSAHWQWQHWQEAGLHIVNLPYIVLQKATISLLGLSVLSIRLPSVLIGLSTGILFFLLMRNMHRSHVALSASVLFAAASWYVAMARFGAPFIMIPFVWVLLTYSFVRLIRLDDPPLAWAALGGVAAAIALYVPYGVYAIISALLVLAIHPTIRRNLSAITGQQVVLGLFVVVPLLLPLGWGLYKDYHQIWPLLGLSSQLPTAGEFVGNIGETLVSFAIHAPLLPELRLGDLPLLSVAVMALFVAGLCRAVIDWRSMRTQFILVSFLVLVIVMSLHPGQKDYAALIVPTFLLIASGVTVLFSEWYRLFPRNPYARSFGLVPIVIFLSFIVVYHYQRYFVAWANAPRTHQVYDTDLSLVREQVAAHPNATLLVPVADAPLYKVLARSHPDMQVNPSALRPGKPILVSNRAVQAAPVVPGQVKTPVVNDSQKASLRFWLIMPSQSN